MDIKKLEILSAAIKVGSMNQAAIELNYTQSGLIYVINALEREIGFPLLNRTATGISLTPQGTEIFPYIEKILEASSEFNNQRLDIIQHNKSILRIGAYPSLVRYWLPEIIENLHKKYPDASFEIYEGTNSIPKLIDDGIIDVGIVERNISDGFAWVYLWEEIVHVAYLKGIFPEDKQSVTLTELENMNFLLPTYNPDSEGVKEFGAWLAKRLPSQKITVNTQSGTGLLSMVAKGFGVTVLSSRYKSECPSSVQMIPIEPPIVRKVGLIYKPGREKNWLIKAFIIQAKAKSDTNNN